MPGLFDRNGIAVPVASDGIKVRAEALQLSDELIRGRISTWLRAPSPVYVKAYSVCFATFGRLFGANVLSVEPLNGLGYLIILVFVFFLAREISDGRFALVAAAIVGIWPSFVLHTTQLLKEPFFIAGMLVIAFICVELLTKRFSWWRAILLALAGGLLAIVVWLARDSMAELLIATPLLTALLLTARIVIESRSSSGPRSEWRARIPALMSAILLTLVTFAVTRAIPQFERRASTGQIVTASDSNISTNSREPQREIEPESEKLTNPWSRGIARIRKLRLAFATEFADAGSNIDVDVPMKTTGDLVRYLPRAVMIGYLAPFPSMWFGLGAQVQRSGRLLSGFEMLVTYFIEGLALIGLWHGRRRYSIWLLWLVSAIGITMLGLVVLNIGALYRLRYVFIILLIALATEGARPIKQWLRRDTTAIPTVEAEL